MPTAIRRPGVSLVEIIVCVSILAMVVTTSLTVLPYSRVFVHRAWDLASAQEIATSQIEYWRTQAFDLLPLCNPPQPAPPAYYGYISNNGTGFYYRDLMDLNAFNAPGATVDRNYLVHIRVTVEWPVDAGHSPLSPPAANQFVLDSFLGTSIR